MTQKPKEPSEDSDKTAEADRAGEPHESAYYYDDAYGYEEFDAGEKGEDADEPDGDLL